MELSDGSTCSSISFRWQSLYIHRQPRKWSCSRHVQTSIVSSLSFVRRDIIPERSPPPPSPSVSYATTMSAPRVVYYRENPRYSPVIDYYRTMAEIRTIEPKKFRRRALQNDRHGVSCVLFLLVYQAQTLRRESQDPVHRLMPSLLTPRQLTRFSWPLNEPTLSPRRTSHTLHSKSS